MDLGTSGMSGAFSSHAVAVTVTNVLRKRVWALRNSSVFRSFASKPCHGRRDTMCLITACVVTSEYDAPKQI